MLGEIVSVNACHWIREKLPYSGPRSSKHNCGLGRESNSPSPPPPLSLRGQSPDNRAECTEIGESSLQRLLIISFLRGKKRTLRNAEKKFLRAGVVGDHFTNGLFQPWCLIRPLGEGGVCVCDNRSATREQGRRSYCALEEKMIIASRIDGGLVGSWPPCLRCS